MRHVLCGLWEKQHEHGQILVKSVDGEWGNAESIVDMWLMGMDVGACWSDG